MKLVLRVFTALILTALSLSPATAQIHILNPFAPPAIRMINPFAAPQGSVRPLLTASTGPADYACAAPAESTTGFVPREGVPWPEIGDKLGINGGDTWNKVVYPYSLCLGTANDFARFELHDTSNDRGLNDPATKRRDEIETTSKFMNGVDSWARFEFSAHVDRLTTGFSVRNFQVHWPSGSSPAIGGTEKYCNGGLCFVISTQSDGTNSIVRASVPLTQDSVHSVVMHFNLGVSGSFVDVWLDGKQIVHFIGPIGSMKQNGYRMRWGDYGVLNGATVVTKYRNLTTPLSAGVNMASFISAPDAW